MQLPIDYRADPQYTERAPPSPQFRPIYGAMEAILVYIYMYVRIVTVRGDVHTRNL
jgi:hypothetical protein